MARAPRKSQGIVSPAAATASVIDTFVASRPNTDAADKADRLAKTLGIATKMAGTYVETMNEEDYKKGQAAARSGILADGSAIRKGELPVGQSKWFLKGFRNEEGYTKALSVGMELDRRWREEAPAEIKNSTDPSQYAAWLQANTAELAGETADMGEDMLMGMSNGLANVRADMVAKQRAYMNNYLTAQSQEQLGTAVSYEVNQLLQGGEGFGDDPIENMASLRDNIGALGTKGYLRGLSPDESKDTVLDTVTAIAKQTGNSALFDAIPKNFRNADINEKIEDLKNQVDQRVIQQAEYTRTLRLREATERADAAYRSVGVTLINEPYKQFSADELQGFEDIEPGLSDRILTAQTRFRALDQQADPAVEQATIRRLTRMANKFSITGDANANPSRALIDAMMKGQFRSPSEMATVNNAIEAAEKASPYLQSGPIVEGTRRVDLLFKQNAPGLFDNPQLRNKVIGEYENYVIQALGEDLAEADSLPFRQLMQIQREAYAHVLETYGTEIGANPNIPVNAVPEDGELNLTTTGVTFSVKPK